MNVLIIALKDLKIAFRDRSALAMMLLAPFALTLAMGFAFGAFSEGGTVTLTNIPLQIVNNDEGDFGSRLVELFNSEELGDLLAPLVSESAQEARSAVDNDQAAAAVIIPPGFSESIMPSTVPTGFQSNRAADRHSSEIEVYANPTRPISVGVIRSVIDRFINIFWTGSAAGEITVAQMLRQGFLLPDQAQTVGLQIGMDSGQAAAQAAAQNSLINLAVEQSSPESQSGYDWKGYLVPSMAILFLMFTVAAGGRSILVERQAGTLPRLLISPSRTVNIIGGKALGIFFIGLAQMVILLAANSLLFRMAWSDIFALILLTIALVMAASGWGVLLAALSRTPAQASNAGTVIALVFAASSGNFVARENLPEWLRNASYISPNAWGLEGYSRLAAGGTLPEIAIQISALLLMAFLLLGVASIAFRRQYQ
jgi:ABC-2 type transport system permease protein